MNPTLRTMVRILIFMIFISNVKSEMFIKTSTNFTSNYWNLTARSDLSCASVCDKDTVCKSFRYHGPSRECQLSTEHHNDSLIHLADMPDTQWHVYNKEVQECPVIQPPTNGFIKGNQNAVGSKKMLGCDEGYITSYPVDGLTVTSECLPDGKWSIVPFNCLEVTCKNVIESGHSSQTGQYQYFDAETRSYVDIFCDFDHLSGTGYTFFAKGTLANLSTLGSHYSRYDKLIIRHLTTADKQRECVLKVLPIYQATYNISLFLTSHDDFNPPRNEISNPYLYIGLIPNSFNNGIRQGTLQGYECNDDIYEFTNSDAHKSNYIAISTDSIHAATCDCCCYKPVAIGFMESSTTVSSGLNMPTKFYYGSYDIRFGGGGTFSWSYYTDRTEGLAFGLPFDFDRP